MTSPSAPRRRSTPPSWYPSCWPPPCFRPRDAGSAHDELVSTDPAADAVLEAVPQRITLTFSADVLTDPGATVSK